MRKLPLSIVVATVAAFSIPLAYAEEEDLDGLEMDVMEEDEAPDEASARIALPEDASQEGVDNSSQGIETANEAREGRREFGQDTAEQARDSRGERGREAAEGARDRQPEQPEQGGPPELPGLPQIPGQ